MRESKILEIISTEYFYKTNFPEIRYTVIYKSGRKKMLYHDDNLPKSVQEFLLIASRDIIRENPKHRTILYV